MKNNARVFFKDHRVKRGRARGGSMITMTIAEDPTELAESEQERLRIRSLYESEILMNRPCSTFISTLFLLHVFLFSRSP